MRVSPPGNLYEPAVEPLLGSCNNPRNRLMVKQFLMTIAAATLSVSAVRAQSADTVGKSYSEEWVFQIRWGHQHEWWQIFQKYQIATLDREIRLGLVKNYVVEVPELHASNDSRWDYRIIVSYPDYASSKRGDDIERQLFPDAATRERDEQKRWDLTLNHWDMPIEKIDPHT